MHRTIQGTLPLGFLGLVFALILQMTAVQIAVGTEFDIANSITAPLRDAVYSHSLSEPEIRSLYRSSLARIESEVFSVALILHTEALTHYYLGRYYQAIKNRNEMIAYAEDLRNHKYLALTHLHLAPLEKPNSYRRLLLHIFVPHQLNVVMITIFFLSYFLYCHIE